MNDVLKLQWRYFLPDGLLADNGDKWEYFCVMNEKKFRRKLAKQVDLKMCFMGSCPNEKSTIVNMILPKNDRKPWKNHCATDCWNEKCESYSVKKEPKIVCGVTNLPCSDCSPCCEHKRNAI